MLESLLLGKGKRSKTKGNITLKYKLNGAVQSTVIYFTNCAYKATFSNGSVISGDYNPNGSRPTIRFPAHTDTVTFELDVRQSVPGTSLMSIQANTFITHVLDWEHMPDVNIQFYGCRALIYVPPQCPVMTNCRYMFWYAEAFNADISGWDTSSIVNAEYMLSNAASFNRNLDRWDVSKIQQANAMFFNAYAYNQPMRSWDLASVTSLEGFLQYATSFNQDLSSWEIPKSVPRTGYDGGTSLWLPAYRPKFV